jgi:hypothetical protein
MLDTSFNYPKILVFSCSGQRNLVFEENTPRGVISASQLELRNQTDPFLFFNSILRYFFSFFCVFNIKTVRFLDGVPC